MANIYIRNIDAAVKAKLAAEAAAKDASLNRLVKQILTGHTAGIEVQNIDERYGNLFKDMTAIYTAQVEQCGEVISKNNYLLEKLLMRETEEDV